MVPQIAAQREHGEKINQIRTFCHPIKDEITVSCKLGVHIMQKRIELLHNIPAT
jgi:hypothetical protein